MQNNTNDIEILDLILLFLIIRNTVAQMDLKTCTWFQGKMHLKFINNSLDSSKPDEDTWLYCLLPPASFAATTPQPRNSDGQTIGISQYIDGESVGITLYRWTLVGFFYRCLLVISSHQ